MTTYTTPGGFADRLYIDMLSQPHLLIAGTTGSGKSVLLHNIINTALLYLPSRYQFIMIDPKETELNEYEHTPHTVHHCRTDADIMQYIQAAFDLMQARFSAMREHRQKETTETHLYIIIDEYFDLKYNLGRPAETLLTRIAAKGRAAHIHIILCTQRPTADIINAAIKANFSSRIALRTATRQESYNIINTTGAETLPRYGFAYYQTPDYTKPVKIQIEKPTEEESEKIIAWWENQTAETTRRRWWHR